MQIQPLPGPPPELSAGALEQYVILYLGCPDRKKFEVDDDDWGVPDEPEQKKVVEEVVDDHDRIDTKSQASLHTNASSMKSEEVKKKKKYVLAKTPK